MDLKTHEELKQALAMAEDAKKIAARALAAEEKRLAAFPDGEEDGQLEISGEICEDLDRAVEFLDLAVDALDLVIYG